MTTVAAGEMHAPVWHGGIGWLRSAAVPSRFGTALRFAVLSRIGTALRFAVLLLATGAAALGPVRIALLAGTARTAAPVVRRSVPGPTALPVAFLVLSALALIPAARPDAPVTAPRDGATTARVPG